MLFRSGAGFETDTNIVTLITKNSETELPIMEKDEVAFRLLDAILELRLKKENTSHE